MMNKIQLVIWREFMSRIRKRSFIVMSLLGPVLIALFAILAIKVSDSYKRYEVVILDPHGVAMETDFKSTEWCKFTYMRGNLTDEEFKKSGYDIMVYINPKFLKTNAIDAWHKEKPNAYARAEIIRQLEYRLEKLKLRVNNISEEAYAHVKQRVRLVDHLMDGKKMAFQANAGNVGFVFSFLIFLFIFTFGIQVMRGVIEEKTSRIVEVVISSLKPVQLMAGKILGIGLVALTQFMIWTTLTAVIMIGVKDQVFPDQWDPNKQTVATSAQEDLAYTPPQSIEINEVASLIYEAVNYPGLLSFFLFFLVFGYLFYAGIFASIGAAVDNDTDVQQFLFPVTLPLILGFIVSWLAIAQPGHWIVEWGSIIPFTSPIVMMVRLTIGFDSGDIWQLYLGMGVLIVSVLFMMYLSSRIYRTGILMYGKKASLKELWRWMTRG